MDFTLIKEHPYITGVTVLGGGILLYLTLRGGSNDTPAAQQQVYYGSQQPSDATVQTNGQLTLAQLSSQTQLALADKSVSLQSAQLSAQTAIAMNQISAQYGVEMGSQSLQAFQIKSDTDLQLKLLDILGRALYPSNANGTVTPTPTTTPATPSTLVPQYSAVSVPLTVNNTTSPYTNPPTWNSTGFPTRDTFGLDPSGGGFHCSPLDSGCVAAQNIASNANDAAIAQAQTNNNAAGLLANYQYSVDAGVITPAQYAIYQSLGGASPISPTTPFPLAIPDDRAPVTTYRRDALVDARGRLIA